MDNKSQFTDIHELYEWMKKQSPESLESLATLLSKHSKNEKKEKMIIKDIFSFNKWMDIQKPCEDIDDIINLLKNLWNCLDKSEQAIKDKIVHVELTASLMEDDKLSIAIALAHDIGRILQYYILKKFDDRTVLHHHLGTQMWEQMIFKGIIKRNHETDIIELSIAYHGRKQFMPVTYNIPEEAIKYLDLMSKVDDISNGCCGAVGYLDREADDDVKGFGTKNQKIANPEVLRFFHRGEKFDKMKFCNTYADYVLFASVLAIQSLKYPETQKLAVKALETRCFDSYQTEYPSALEGYRAIFGRRLESETAKECFSILLGYYYHAKNT